MLGTVSWHAQGRERLCVSACPCSRGSRGAAGRLQAAPWGRKAVCNSVLVLASIVAGHEDNAEHADC